MNFFSRMKEKFSLAHENVMLEKQYDHMIKEIDMNITQATTDEERQKYIMLKQDVIDKKEKKY